MFEVLIGIAILGAVVAGVWAAYFYLTRAKEEGEDATD